MTENMNLFCFFCLRLQDKEKVTHSFILADVSVIVSTHFYWGGGVACSYRCVWS